MSPDLADLLDAWLKEHDSKFYVQRPTDEEKGWYPFAVAIAMIHYPGFGSVVTVDKDRVVVSHDARDPDGFTIMAADPRFLDLLSNRLYILERGFIKAMQSRIETAQRDGEAYETGH